MQPGVLTFHSYRRLGQHGGQVSAHLINNDCQIYMRLLCEGRVSHRLVLRRKYSKITAGSSSSFRRMSFILFHTNSVLQESEINCHLMSYIKKKNTDWGCLVAGY